MRKKLVNKHEYESFFRSAVAMSGSVTPIVFRNVLLVMVYSSIISYLYNYFPEISLPIGPFEYAGLVMGLILVFRVNAGYDRWWEARKLWGNIVNQSRNLVIIIANYTENEDNSWRLKVTNYAQALPFIIKNNLRGIRSIEEIKHLLPKELADRLRRSEHRPNLLFAEIAKEINCARKNKSLDHFSFMQAEEKRAELMDCNGACERILTTPIPYVMAIKSRRFILLFLIAMPFALVSVSPAINPLISGLVSYTLLSLDQIGVELQNPFSEKRLSHLPLNDICKTIQNNILEIQETIK